MDIYAYLKKDHRLVKDLMEEFLGTDSTPKREQLFAKIRDELEIHAETEEKTFYAAIKEKGGKGLKEKEHHAEDEHGEIRKFLHDMDAAEPGSEEWLIAFGELKHSVEHHVEEEEGELFEKAKKVLSESRAEALAKEMDELKQKKQKNRKETKEAEEGLLNRLIF